MQKHAGSFDFILDAVSADHDINAYIKLLRRDGNITLVGTPEEPLGVSAFGLIMGARIIHRRMRSDPHLEGHVTYARRCQVRCEVPLLHRHGFSPI